LPPNQKKSLCGGGEGEAEKKISPEKKGKGNCKEGANSSRQGRGVVQKKEKVVNKGNFSSIGRGRGEFLGFVLFRGEGGAGKRGRLNGKKIRADEKEGFWGRKHFLIGVCGKKRKKGFANKKI